MPGKQSLKTQLSYLTPTPLDRGQGCLSLEAPPNSIQPESYSAHSQRLGQTLQMKSQRCPSLASVQSQLLLLTRVPGQMNLVQWMIAPLLITAVSRLLQVTWWHWGPAVMTWLESLKQYNCQHQKSWLRFDRKRRWSNHCAHACGSEIPCLCYATRNTDSLHGCMVYNVSTMTIGVYTCLWK